MTLKLEITPLAPLPVSSVAAVDVYLYKTWKSGIIWNASTGESVSMLIRPETNQVWMVYTNATSRYADYLTVNVLSAPSWLKYMKDAYAHKLDKELPAEMEALINDNFKDYTFMDALSLPEKCQDRLY